MNGPEIILLLALLVPVALRLAMEASYHYSPPARRCICGHLKTEHRFMGTLASCEHGLDSIRDECCSCFRYREVAAPPERTRTR